MNIAGRHVCCKAKVVIVTHESLPGQSPSSTKIGEHNWRGGLSIVIQRLHSDAGISHTIIIIVTHGFPYSSRDSKVQAARPLKPELRGISRRRPRRMKRRTADRSTIRATIITIVIRRSSAPVVKRHGNFVNAIKITARKKERASRGEQGIRWEREIARSIDSYCYRWVPREKVRSAHKRDRKRVRDIRCL